MLQNARVTALTVSELLRGKQQGGGVLKLPPPSQGLVLKLKTLKSMHGKLEGSIYKHLKPTKRKEIIRNG